MDKAAQLMNSKASEDRENNEISACDIYITIAILFL